MSTAQGPTQDISQGGQEAFRALINSIVPKAATGRDGKLARETVEKLSAKLNELIGDEAIKDYEHRRNERGELVNEDGLPIIDISEPLPQIEESDDKEPMIQDVPLIRLSSLPSVAREKLRQHRDRILDEFEDEERQEKERYKRTERQQREEILRARKTETINEKARLQQAKEFQKKMGKALLRNMGNEPDSDSSLTGEKTKKQESLQAETVTGERKKTVTFAETNDSGSNASRPKWDDVTAGRLRTGKRPTLLQPFRPDVTPVKLSVIERKPAVHISSTANRPTPFTQSATDSDDESEPENSQSISLLDNDGNDEVSAAGSLDSEEDNEETELENEYDLDYAQHQREITLEYHNKRNTIGQDTAKAMIDHSHKEELESELTLGSPTLNNQSRPSVSRFKANRLASAYSTSTGAKPLTSIEDFTLPELNARTIQRAIRSGRVNGNNQLVGGDHDSDSEIETEGLQEVLELLEKYNLGPDGQYLYAPPQTQARGTSAAATTDLNADRSAVVPSGTVAQQQGQQQRSLPPLNRPKTKTSKFKADRSQSGRPSTTPRSETSTPVTSRSSLKLPPALADAVVEKKQNKPQALNPMKETPSPTSVITSPVTIDPPSSKAPRANLTQSNIPGEYTPMVIESPSFSNRFTQAMQTSTASDHSTSFPSMIVDSPSFPPPGRRSRRPERPPTVVSSQNLVSNLPADSITAEGPITALPGITRAESSRIVAPTVLERAPAPRDSASVAGSAPASGKVSRFKQFRGGQS